MGENVRFAVWPQLRFCGHPIGCPQNDNRGGGGCQPAHLIPTGCFLCFPGGLSNMRASLAAKGRVREHFRGIFRSIVWQAEQGCLRFTGNGTEAEDLSQDVFLRVYRTLASYRSAHGGFATWVTSVTRNLLIDHYRRTKRDRVTDSLDDAMPVVESKESTARRPDEQALLGELSGQVQTALTKLSPELREAVILRDLQQLEYGEIQRVLAVPEGTVKSRINRGRIELARVLHQMGVRPS